MGEKGRGSEGVMEGTSEGVSEKGGMGGWGEGRGGEF